jgi:hypothetical protein
MVLFEKIICGFLFRCQEKKQYILHLLFIYTISGSVTFLIRTTYFSGKALDCQGELARKSPCEI